MKNPQEETRLEYIRKDFLSKHPHANFHSVKNLRYFYRKGEITKDQFNSLVTPETRIK